MSMDGRIMTECRYSDVEGRSSHFHNAYEMLFIREGSGRIEVSGHEYPVGPNTLMFFSNLEEHVTKIEKRPFRRWASGKPAVRSHRKTSQSLSTRLQFLRTCSMTD